MKKRGFTSIFFVLVLVILSVCLVSCEISGIPILGDKPKEVKPGEIPIRVKIDDDNFPSYRTIVPEAWTQTKKESLTFKLENVTSSPHTTIDTYSWSQLKTNGSAMVVLNEGTYMLKMTATNSDGKIVLYSKNTQVIVGTTSYIDFVMYPQRENTTSAQASARGKVDIDVIYHNPEIHAGSALVLGVKGSLTPYAHGSSGAVGVVTSLTASTASNNSGDDRVDTSNFKSDNVVAGVYTFKAELYNTANTAAFNPSNLITTISSVVIVDPMLTSHSSIICPLDLDSAPFAPKNFKVTYQPPASGDDYAVKFTWEDTSVNEDNFVITIIHGTDETEIELPAGSEEYELNSSELLALGEKYKATIHAKNGYGKSKVVDYLDHRNGNYIHLNRITYKLKGGTFLPHPDNSLLGLVDSTSGDVIAYYTFRKAGYEFNLIGHVKLPSIYKMNSDSPAKPLLLKGWLENPADTTKVINSIPQGETKAYTLTALWEGTLGVGVSFPGYEEGAYILNSANFINYEIGSTTKIKMNILPPYGNEVTNVVSHWYLDNTDITSDMGSSNVNDVTGATPYGELVFDSSKLPAGVTINKGEKHQIRCVSQIETTNPLGQVETRTVSSYCYINITK